MAAEDTRRPPAARDRGTALVLLQVGGVLGSLLALLCGAALLVPSVLWLIDLHDNPREPPGGFVSTIPLTGAAIGIGFGLVGVAGLALVVFSRWLANRRR